VEGRRSCLLWPTLITYSHSENQSRISLVTSQLDVVVIVRAGVA